MTTVSLLSASQRRPSAKFDPVFRSRFASPHNVVGERAIALAIALRFEFEFLRDNGRDSPSSALLGPGKDSDLHGDWFAANLDSTVCLRSRERVSCSVDVL